MAFFSVMESLNHIPAALTCQLVCPPPLPRAKHSQCEVLLWFITQCSRTLCSMSAPLGQREGCQWHGVLCHSFVPRTASLLTGPFPKTFSTQDSWWEVREPSCGQLIKKVAIKSIKGHLTTRGMEGSWTSEGMKSETRNILRSLTLSTSYARHIYLCTSPLFVLLIPERCLLLVNILATHSSEVPMLWVQQHKKSDLLTPNPSSPRKKRWAHSGTILCKDLNFSLSQATSCVRSFLFCFVFSIVMGLLLLTFR